MRRSISIGLLFISWLLAGCAAPAQPQPATPDVAAISTASVATVYANLTLSPAAPAASATPTPPPLPAAITDKFNVPMVLVPAGPFLMGRAGSAGGQPYVEVTIGDYYIDTFEVTNQRYMICVHAGACDAPDYKGSYTHASYYDDPAFGNYPVLINKSQMAEMYCAWRGAHLPSEIEWEKAMRGTDGRSYPWGDTPPDDTRANLCDRNCYQSWAEKSFDDGYTDVAPVGSFPAGASPYGVMDMIGNLNEDVTGVGVAYQAYLGQPAPAEVLIEPRGGSWNTDFSAVLKTLDGYSYYSLDGGFRCASEPVGAPVSPVFRPLNPAPTLTPVFTPTRTPLPPTATATILPAARSGNVYPIAFVANRVEGKYTSLQVVNDDGSHLRTIFPLQQEPQMEIRQPTWAPDGKSLYFIGFNTSASSTCTRPSQPKRTRTGSITEWRACRISFMRNWRFLRMAVTWRWCIPQAWVMKPTGAQTGTAPRPWACST
jgi:formylglycine-generating enzyme required for sulfatase activity